MTSQFPWNIKQERLSILRFHVKTGSVSSVCLSFHVRVFVILLLPSLCGKPSGRQRACITGKWQQCMIAASLRAIKSHHRVSAAVLMGGNEEGGGRGGGRVNWTEVKSQAFGVPLPRDYIAGNLLRADKEMRGCSCCFPVTLPQFVSLFIFGYFFLLSLLHIRRHFPHKDKSTTYQQPFQGTFSESHFRLPWFQM